MGRKPDWRLVLIAGIALAGIALRAVIMAKLDRAELCGSDFAVFYAGGILLGTPDLYSAPAAQAIQTREMGCTTQSAIFIRLPYFAALMRPWAQLPFWPAFALWRLANVVAVAVFIWLWPAPREWSLLACAWSLPLAYAVTNGQDVGFLLMWLAVAAALLKRDAAFPAGLALAMCAAKFHLFVLLPMLFEVRLRKLCYGFAAGAAVLLALCFAVGGRGWPREFMAAATDSRIDAAPNLLFNARGIAHGSVAVQIAISALVLASAFYVFRRGDLWYRLASALTGGLLLSHHNTISDAALLIPVALILAFHASAGVTKLLAVFLVSPIAYILGRMPQLADIPRLSLLALAVLLAWEVRPVRREAATKLN
jgi:hypothetical protein